MVRAQGVTRHLLSSAVAGVAVVADDGLLQAGPEEAGPVDGVVVAEEVVVGEIDVPSTDFMKRLQPQGGDPLLLED